MEKKSLAFQLNMYFILWISMILIVVSILNYKVGAGIVKTNTEKMTRESLVRTGNYITAYTNKLKTTADALSFNPSLRTYIDKNTESSNKETKDIIRTLIDSDANLVSAILVTKDGRLISNESKIEMRTSSNMMDEDWYKDAIMKNSRPVLTSARKEYCCSSKENWVISVTREIVDKEGNNLGVLRLDVDYKYVEKYLRQLDLGHGGYAFIVNGDGRVIYHPDERVLTSSRRRDEVQKISKLDGYINGGASFVSHHHIKDLDWDITCVASLDQLKIVKKSLQDSFIVIAGLAIVATSIAVYLLVKKWLRPIKTLQETMVKIESGENNVRASKAGVTELQDLSNHFNLMLDKIDGLMNDIKNKEQDIRNYEQEALSSQINPHFLYNTLDTIIWMAEFGDSDSVVDLTKSLAKFFRLSLNQGSEIISLKDEIDHIRQYLFIQKKRYGSKLNYSISELEKFDDFKLPKLVLQPIVENAIYHGIKEIDRPGQIDIEVYERDKYIYISIQDNGKGMPSYMSSGKNYARLGGVGIKNVDRRLLLHYGKAYKMDIESVEGQYTRVLICLPRQDVKI